MDQKKILLNDEVLNIGANTSIKIQMLFQSFDEKQKKFNKVRRNHFRTEDLISTTRADSNFLCKCKTQEFVPRSPKNRNCRDQFESTNY